MKAFRYCTSALLLVGLASCNGDSPTGNTMTTTSTTSTVMPPAEISIDISDAEAFSSGMGNLFRFNLTMTESAGTGANINFARLELLRATGEVEEVQEIGSDIIVAASGDNRLEGNTSETVNVTFFFRATVKRGRQLRVTVGFTDDLGNDTEPSITFTFL